MIKSAAAAANSAPTRSRPMPIQSTESSSAPMLMSAATPRVASSFITTARQSPSSGPTRASARRRPSHDRDPERLSVRWSRSAGSGSLRVVRVAVVEIRHDVVLDTVEVALDVRRGADADEHRAVALAADANRPEEGVERPLGALGVQVGALGDDRVGRRRELLSVGDMRKPSSSRCVWSIATSAQPRRAGRTRRCRR